MAIIGSDSIDTLAQLLHKADNASTDAERETFLAAAERKAARASLTLADLRAHTKDKHEKQGKPIIKRVEVGVKGQMRRIRLSELMRKIAEVYDIKWVASSTGAYVRLVGLKEDIEITEALYGSLVFQMVTEGTEYLRTDEHKKSGAGRAKGLDNFYTAFISIVVDRIRRQYQDTLSEFERERSKGDTSMALVLKDKRAEIGSTYNEEFGGIKGLKEDRHSYVRDAYSNGYTKGHEANISGRQSIDEGKGKIAL